MHAEPVSYGLLSGPVGELLLGWSSAGLSEIRFGGTPEADIPLEPIPFGAQQQLEAYFAGFVSLNYPRTRHQSCHIER